MPESGEVRARALGMKSRKGWVYRDVDLDIPAGSLALITGPSGSGKTALSLTLAGRMRPTAGELTIASFDARRKIRDVRRHVGLGEFGGVNDFTEALSVADQVGSDLALYGRPSDRRAVDAILGIGDLAIDPATPIADLAASDRLLLGAALGLLTKPPILVLDRLDADTTVEEQRALLAALRKLSAGNLTVIASTIDPALADEADLAVTLAHQDSPAEGR